MIDGPVCHRLAESALSFDELRSEWVSGSMTFQPRGLHTTISYPHRETRAVDNDPQHCRGPTCCLRTYRLTTHSRKKGQSCRKALAKPRFRAGQVEIFSAKSKQQIRREAEEIAKESQLPLFDEQVLSTTHPQSNPSIDMPSNIPFDPG